MVSLEGYGCAHLSLAVKAAGAIVHYIEETQKGILAQITGLTTYSSTDFMALDTQTQRNLELFRGAGSESAEGSLLSVIDLTRTPMGGRLLRKWLGQPLLEVTGLVRRQDAISWFVDKTLARNHVISMLGSIADLERLINRVSALIASPRELVTLRHSLETVPNLKELIEAESDTDSITWLKDELKPCKEVVELIQECLSNIK